MAAGSMRLAHPKIDMQVHALGVIAEGLTQTDMQPHGSGAGAEALTPIGMGDQACFIKSSTAG
jgi:hypothetical protein